MNCLQALAIAVAALVASGEPVLQPLIDAPAHLERGEAMLRHAARSLEARLSKHHGDEAGYARATIRIPDSQIHAARLL